MHTNNSTQHTPTPWRLCKVGPYIETVADGRGVNIIAQCEDIDSDRPRAEDLANAAFIVRAVNAHGDLVAALKGLLADKYLADPINKDRMAPARAALAKLST